MKSFGKIILWLFGAILAAALLLIIYLTIAEYRPEAIESVEVRGKTSETLLQEDQTVELISWNVGYAALGKDADFILDGGGKAPVSSRETVNENIAGIEALLNESGAEIRMIQELDTDSARSYGADMRENFGMTQDAFAMNYSCKFVPFPWPPIGKVNSGVYTTSDYRIESAERVSLPVPFSWPLRIANLKRCLLISRFPIENSERELVVINLHLEAFDDGEGKIAQTEQTKAIMQEEFEKGNYVIVGGDFNQSFPGSLEPYPNTRPDFWHPGTLEEGSIPDGWTFAYDLGTPSCRSANQPYNPEDTENTQHYVIDGFILSPNIQLDHVQTLDEGFVYADHNPVRLSVTLKPAN